MRRMSFVDSKRAPTRPPRPPRLSSQRERGAAMHEMVGQIGDVATGSLVASAVEPSTGAPAEGAHPAICRNCQAPLGGAYCHACGQRGHVHRTIASIGHDLAHGVFHFEGKIWHTLPLLMWRPGDLTRRYIAGERARFISPVALFLFSVFLLATVLGSVVSAPTLNGLKNGIAGTTSNLVKAQAGTEKELKSEIEDRNDLAAQGKPTTDSDKTIARLKQDQKALAALISGKPVEAVTGGANSNWKYLNDRLQHAKENPELLIYKLKNSAYKFSWVLVPLSLPFVWLLFPFSRRFGLYDHAIFTIYSLASMSLLTVLLTGLMQITALTAIAIVLLIFLPPIHMYRQLRGAYSLGRVSALVRTAILLFFVLFVVTFWIAFLMLVGAA